MVVVGILALARGTPLQRALEDNEDLGLDFCTTKECIGTSYRILKSMNETVDPCDNFYQVRVYF